MGKLKRAVKNVRIIVLAACLVFAFIALQPDPYNEGVMIRSVDRNSSAALAGIHNPLPGDRPMFREVIFEVNGKAVNSVQDYAEAVMDVLPDEQVSIRTRSSYVFVGDERQFSFAKRIEKYTLTAKPLYRVTVLNETEEVVVPKIITVNETINGTNVSINKTINETIVRNKIQRDIIGTEELGLHIEKAPTNNVKKGLDLQGGTRVLLQPEDTISDDDVELIITNLKEKSGRLTWQPVHIGGGRRCE